MKIIFDAIYGVAKPDGQIIPWIESVKDKETVIIGSELIMTEMRAQHKEKRINIEEIIWRHICPDTKEQIETEIQIDENGRFLESYYSFCDFSINALGRIVSNEFRKDNPKKSR